jgi:hypothetical protein
VSVRRVQRASTLQVRAYRRKFSRSCESKCRKTER